MAWRRPGDKALSEPMMVSFLTHIWSLGLSELQCLARQVTRFDYLFKSFSWLTAKKIKVLHYWPFAKGIHRVNPPPPPPPRVSNADFLYVVCVVNWTNCKQISDFRWFDVTACNATARSQGCKLIVMQRLVHRWRRFRREPCPRMKRKWTNSGRKWNLEGFVSMATMTANPWMRSTVWNNWMS